MVFCLIWEMTAYFPYKRTIDNLASEKRAVKNI